MIVNIASTIDGMKPFISSDGQTPKNAPTIERCNKKRKWNAFRVL